MSHSSLLFDYCSKALDFDLKDWQKLKEKGPQLRVEGEIEFSNSDNFQSSFKLTSVSTSQKTLLFDHFGWERFLFVTFIVKEKIQNDKIYINCHYKEKKEAKDLGAIWDPHRKSWYFKPKKTDEEQLKKLAKFQPWIESRESGSGIRNVISNGITFAESKYTFFGGERNAKLPHLPFTAWFFAESNSKGIFHAISVQDARRFLGVVQSAKSKKTSYCSPCISYIV